MIRPNRSHASLGVALALGLSALVVAPGCEIIASFDRSKIDAGEPEDAAPYDASYDTSPEADGSPPSSEAGTNDAGDASQAPVDSGIDSTVSDAGDATAPDASGADAADASTPDTGVDSSQPDANDANVPDAADADVSEASDDGAPE
jgi:hypothetical protein